MRQDLAKSVAIVGVAESDQLGVTPNKSALQHHAEAAYNALEDAGLKKDDVDGLFTARYSTLATGEYMGIKPRYSDSTTIGGSSFVVHVAHAIAAINAGFCEVALITHGETGRSSRGRRGAADATLADAQYEMPYGIAGAPIRYAIACSRYMHQYGEERTRQAMAEIAVSTRKWARMNPKALMRDEMTFEDYHNSRWVAWPFHLLDCCLVTDAGAAVVIAKADRARALKKKPVWVLGAAEHHNHSVMCQMPDLTVSPAQDTGKRALDCQTTYFYPRPICPQCFSRKTRWLQSSGKGTLYAFSIVHRPPSPAFAGITPYVVAFVLTEEGVRIPTDLVNVEPDPAVIKIGMPVEVVFEDVSDAISLPMFRPA